MAHDMLGDNRTPGLRPAERDRARRPESPVYAALDLGTNNCRLLVARPLRWPAAHPSGPAAGNGTNEGFRVIDAFSRIVRLGEGLSATGRLSDAAMARTVEALAICAGKMARQGVTMARSVATEACRRAGNCETFLDRVKAETGISLEIIPQSEEARLALYGCAPLLDPAVPNALVFDIGGGSTELGWMQLPEDGGFFGDGAAPELAGWYSLPIGVVTLAERHGGRRVTAAAYRAMVEEVEAAVAPFEAEHRLAERVAAGRLQMLGTSGTVTTLAGIEQDLPRYQRTRVDGCYLDFATVAAISRRVAGMSYDERVAHPCIGRERADLVIAGCAILEAFCRLWPVGRLRVADRGLREGMLFLMMHGPAACAPRRPAGSTTPPATPTSGVPRAGGLQPA